MSNYDLIFKNLHPTWKISIRDIKTLTRELLPLMGVKQAEICWLFVNSRRMAADNAKYMGHEGSTDVITLQYKQVEQKEQLFGDVIICIDEAILYAEEYSTTPQSEIIRYLIHSILHLQGYNDINPSDRKIMKRHENKWVKWAEERITSKILQQK